MKRYLSIPVWLWIIQVATGALLVLYVIIHTIDNAMILVSQKAFDDMLALWHETLPHWMYIIMVIGLVTVFILHTANGIRIASKPYKDIDVSWRHNRMMKHSGTIFWYTQVVTGSLIAMFGVWHLLVQHGTIATTTAAQSMARVSPTIYLVYLVFLAALMFHSFNGIRSVLIKLGFMTDKAKEAVLVGVLALMFVVFFLAGALSMAKFIPDPVIDTAGAVSTSDTVSVEGETPVQAAEPVDPGQLNILRDEGEEGDGEDSGENPESGAWYERGRTSGENSGGNGD